MMVHSDVVARDVVAQDMETIFGLSRHQSTDLPRPHGPLRLGRARSGNVAVALAGAAALLGLVALPFLPRTQGGPVAVRRIASPARALPMTPASPPALAAPTPPPVVRAEPRRALPPPRVRPGVRSRIITVRPVSPSVASPRLTGEALRRALAADVLLTRRLNAEAAATGRPPPVRVVETP